MAGTIATLQSRLSELQNTWDTHSYAPATTPPETSSISEKLGTTKAANDILEKQASTARQRITDLEKSLSENTRRIEALQKKIE